MALITKAAPAPEVATITPPIAGPTLRARLNPMALAMTAAGIDSRGTCSPIEACHAGANAAVPQPMRNVSARRMPGVIVPKNATSASASEAPSASSCEHSMSSRRS
jgi:hypothetical protein